MGDGAMIQIHRLTVLRKVAAVTFMVAGGVGFPAFFILSYIWLAYLSSPTDSIVVLVIFSTLFCVAPVLLVLSGRSLWVTDNRNAAYLLAGAIVTFAMSLLLLDTMPPPSAW